MDDLHQPRGLFRARAPKPHPSILFLKEMLRDPLHIAAVSPSGKELARLVVRALPATDPVRVVELGGGTGSFTREMLAHRVHDEDLLVLEIQCVEPALLHAPGAITTLVVDLAKALAAYQAAADYGVAEVTTAAPSAIPSRIST